MEVEGVTFSSKVAPLGSTKQLLLGGAVIGIYLEEDVIPHLALEWKNKTTEELGKSEDFFMDIVTCPYEKFTRVTLVLPLSGSQYSGKVSEACKAAWEAAGIYGEAEAQALEKFKTIAFSKDSSIPDKTAAVIENSVLAQGILASIIGKNGVSPAAKASIAQRISKLYFPEEDRLATMLSGMEVEGISFSPTVQPLGSTKELLLRGAGFRGLDVEVKLKKFTAIGIYI
ncbi:hypothetical protein SUGI_1192970 [Cryptomeria japonica]|nr:hypothetical protein SUGI_1192970 [Cryptomeria japonica]